MGSEMCIRDRLRGVEAPARKGKKLRAGSRSKTSGATGYKAFKKRSSRKKKTSSKGSGESGSAKAG